MDLNGLKPERGRHGMRKKLTITLVKSLKPTEKPFEVIDTEINGFLLRVQPTGGMTYYQVYRTAEGKKKRVKIGRANEMTPAKARDKAIQFSGKAASGVDVQEEKAQARLEAKEATNRTLGAFLENVYYPDILTSRRSGEATRKRLVSCFGFLFGKSMADINKWRIASWQKKQVESGKAPTTVNRDVNVLRAILSHAEEKELLAGHPLKGLKPLPVEDDKRVRYLEPDEEKQLLAALDEREAETRKGRGSHNAWRGQRGMELLPDLEGKAFVDHIKPIVLLALHTGLRRGELLGLEWSSVNFITETLIVTARTAKTAKTRHVHLNGIALGLLKEWRKQSQEDGVVFPGKNGQKMGSLKTAWTGLMKRANIEDFRLHDCRHDFASKLVMRGVDLYMVKELLGHSSITMTERYAHLAPGQKAKAVALLAMGQ